MTVLTQTPTAIAHSVNARMLLPTNDAFIEDLMVQCFAHGGGLVSAYVHEGVVILNGAVRSYYLKQLAQEFAMQVDGVRRVVNDIDVCRTDAFAVTAGPCTGESP